MAELLADRYGTEKIIFNLACKGRDEAYLKRYVEEVYKRGIRNALILQGDGRSSVKPTDLIKYASSYLNVGAVANPNAEDMERELELTNRKIMAGAKYLLTQPVFDLEMSQEFSMALPDVDIYYGLLVLPSRYEDAVLIPQRYPGIEVPDETLHRLRDGSTNLDIAREILDGFRRNGMNTYVSSPSYGAIASLLS